MSSSAAHVATSSCLEAFGALRGHLQAAKPGLAGQVSNADIEDEFGRFRLWAANIGALSRGHGSLDYRLRDAPVVLEGALKLLNELQQELHQMCLVLSGERLPYEAQISSRAGHVDDSDTSSLSSDSESSSDSSSDSDEEKLAPSELRRRVSALSNINDNLYRLSRSIRAPASHSRSLKALSYKLIDKETGVDVVQQYVPVDLAFTKDLFSQLRRNAQDQYGNCPMLDDADVAMIKRLAQGITRRRQQFLYWKHHRKKLGFNAEREILKIPKPAPTVQLNGDETKESVAGPRASLPVVGKAQTESSRPKTTLTETTATLFIGPTTVPDGNQSATSYATTARGLDGSRIEFPKLPKSIKKGKDFECPYCLMICPPHYQMPRAWRAHLLRDLRPYMCTHKHCQLSDELYATKQEWLNHEHTHQKAWQCPEHASTHFLTPEDLKGHLLAETHESLQRMGLEDLLAICETVRPNSRTICPICFVDTGSSYGLENHLANHLERFAAFALPRDVDGDVDEESHNGSNMSEHAIARSDQSDVSELSQANDWHSERLEIMELARRVSNSFPKNRSNDTIPAVKKLNDQMMRIAGLPAEVVDMLSFDLQFKAVFKTIPKLLSELAGFMVPYVDEDNSEELTSELIFQMERLDKIIQEYAVDHALDSSHPRLGMDAALSDQSPDDGLKQSQTDWEPAPSRDSSPDSVVNRTGPRLSTMDLNRSQPFDTAEEATSPIRDSSPDSIVNRSSSILSTMDLNRLQTSNPAEDDVSPTRDSSLDSQFSRTALDNVVGNASTRNYDTTLEKTNSESFCRKQLTTYEVFTLRPNLDKIKSKMEDRWANVDITQKSHPTKQIIREIRELDAGLLSIFEKRALLFPNQNTQVTSILSNKINNEREGQLFEWVLAQLYCEEAVNLKTGKKETASMTIYLKRAPLPGIDVIQLYRERKELAGTQAMQRQELRIFQHQQQEQAMQQQRQGSFNSQTSENIPKKNPSFLIANLTSLLTDAYRIQQRLRDFAAEDKATPNAIVRLNRIFPDICLGITSLIKTIREGVVDPHSVTSIEMTDTRCRRLFEDASRFLDKFKKGTRPSWGSRTEYRNDIEQLVTSAQRALQEIDHLLEVQAKVRVIRRGRGQDEPTPRPSTGVSTLPTDNEGVSGELSRAGEHEQRPESPKSSQDTDDIHIPGLEGGSEVGHETPDKFVAGRGGSPVRTRQTRPLIWDSNPPQIRGRPVIIDERPLKGILKPGRGKFPEDPSPTREGIAPLGDEFDEGIYLRPSRAEGAPPPDARWTKINRLLVNPEALDEGRERYEARDDFVIVLRVLTKEEIQAYADATVRIRAARAAKDEALNERRSRHAQLKSPAPEQDGSDGDDEGNNSEYERSRKRDLARLPRTRLDSKGKDAISMSSTDRLSNSDVESPPSRVGVSRDSNMQKLDKILTDEALRLLFREQLRDTHCEENLSFYLNINEFLKSCIDALQGMSPSSRSKNPGRSLDAIKETMASAYGIYNAFLAPGSPCELNIDHSLRSQLDSCINKALRIDDPMIERLMEVTKLFEEAQLAVFKLMASDSVPKFMKNSKYEQTLKNYDFESIPAHPRNKNEATPHYTHWTKIDRKIVSLETLTQAEESFEETDDFVFVKRVLNQDEVRAYTERIVTIRTAGKVQTLYSDKRLSRFPQDGVDYKSEELHHGRADEYVVRSSQIVPAGVAQEEVSAYNAAIKLTRPERPKEPDPLERTEPAAPNEEDLAGFYYGYMRPPNRELAPIQQTLRGGRADGGVAVVDESRWTKINRRYVSPEALDRAHEKYFVWDHYVIVHRMLSREEVDAYTTESTSIRAARADRNEEDDDRRGRSRSPTLLPLPALPERNDNKESEDDGEGGGEPPRPSSTTSSLFDDNVILNPHTLPRGSMDTSPVTDRGSSPPSPSARTDNKRSPRKNYPSLPPHSPSAHFNEPLDRNASVAPALPLVFLCTFAFADCRLSFATKHHWKNHVASDHMSFVYWECPLKPCPRPLFHTEDLLEQHLRWVHEPPDHLIAALVEKGEKPGRSLIEEIRCPVPGCTEGWKGVGKLAWDERMEHVAGHWEAVARREEAGGWTEEGGGLLEWAIREGAVVELEGGRLICQEALGLRQPEKSNDEKQPTYDNASGSSASSVIPTHYYNDVLGPIPFPEGEEYNSDGVTRNDNDASGERPGAHDRSPSSGDHSGPNPHTRSSTTNPTAHQTTNRSEGKPSVRFVPEHSGELHHAPSNTDLQPTRTASRHISGYATSDSNDAPSTAAAGFAAAATAAASATAMLGRPRARRGMDPTTQETTQHDDVDAAHEAASRWAAGLRGAQKLSKRVSGIVRNPSSRSTRDHTGPETHEVLRRDDARRSTPLRRPNSLSEPSLESPGLSIFVTKEFSRFEDGPPRPGEGSPSLSTLEDGDASSTHAEMGAEDEEDETEATQLDDERFKRLKRVFSRRNWTEKGKGEQKGKETDKEDDGGGGRRSSMFRS